MRSKRILLLLLVAGGVLLTVIWSSTKSSPIKTTSTFNPQAQVESSSSRNYDHLVQPAYNVSHGDESRDSRGSQQCSIFPSVDADIDTSQIYPTLNFNAKWMTLREYWSEAMEKRYHRRRLEMWPKLPLKVIVMPHSHNDPGWLKTYEGYFHSSTKLILDNAVDKLVKYSNMTFIWTEISFLSMWWESAKPVQRTHLKKLVDEGRFEILTGGWVMTDEANVDLFAMVDQLVEGHQWLLNHLGIQPKSSWSVDPFGHGGAFPYVLKASGIDGMVIMRIHYAWKEWFAKEQSGDFLWTQPWDTSGKDAILCHNFPYDIYSIKGSCGPQAQTCLQYNFATMPGQYSEYYGRVIPVNPSNIKERSETILEQWGKTGSLFPHNVVLVPLGDDFTYVNEAEWDQQYSNYNQIIEYINTHGYNADIQWGTLTDYFNAVHARTTRFDKLTGDFFVYSDVFSEGVPAYWSGYYSTRPFMKKLSRELVASLRSAEILFTWAYNAAKQMKNEAALTMLDSIYISGLTKARQNLALFQHHDAITGTAKQFVTHDYGEKLFDGIIATRNLMKISAQYLLMKDRSAFQRKFLESDYERPDYGSREKPLALDIRNGAQNIVLYNSLGQDKLEVASFFLDGIDSRKDVCVRDPQGRLIPVQFNPTWTTDGFIRLEKHFMEVSFFAHLPAMSVSKYTVQLCSDGGNDEKKYSAQTKVYCLRCPKRHQGDDEMEAESPMTMQQISDGAVVISNANLQLTFDEETHLLNLVRDKKLNVTKNVKLSFGGYPTMQFRNGAYLFKPDPKLETVAIIDPIDNLKEVIIITGHIFSEISLIYEGGNSLTIQGSFVHTVRLYHAPLDSPLAKSIYIENNFNFGDQNNFRDVDMYMRLESNLKNDKNVWYSDSSGLTMQRRTPALNASGLEGNTYPITNQIYLEDSEARMTLLVDHATGASSQKQGWLEVIVDRRASYDDARGMGEGILDNRDTQHRYWLLMEVKESVSDDMYSDSSSTKVSLPTHLANVMSRSLNYPPIQFVCAASLSKGLLNSQVKGLQSPLSDDVHLFNLRTLSGKDSALLILHRQGFDCGYWHEISGTAAEMPAFEMKISSLQRTSLTGNKALDIKNQTSFSHMPEAMRLQTFKLHF